MHWPDAATTAARYIVSVGHYPSYDMRFEYVSVPTVGCYKRYYFCGVHIHLCGHVHDAWRYRWDDVGHYGIPVLNFNIGTDAWKYRPISEVELDAYIGKVLAGKA